MFIEHLPSESATKTAMRNAIPEAELERLAEKGEPEKAAWSHQEQLLAAVVDALRRVEYILILANSDKGSRKPKAPEQVPRPGVRQQRKKVAPITDSGAERLFKLINGGAA